MGGERSVLRLLVIVGIGGRRFGRQGDGQALGQDGGGGGQAGAGRQQGQGSTQFHEGSRSTGPIAPLPAGCRQMQSIVTRGRLSEAASRVVNHTYRYCVATNATRKPETTRRRSPLRGAAPWTRARRVQLCRPALFRGGRQTGGQLPLRTGVAGAGGAGAIHGLVHFGDVV